MKRVIFEIDISRGPISWRQNIAGIEYSVSRMLGKKELETVGMSDKDRTRFVYVWLDPFHHSNVMHGDIRIDVRYAKPQEKVSNQFLGYEWMVKNIIHHGCPYEVEE